MNKFLFATLILSTPSIYAWHTGPLKLSSHILRKQTRSIAFASKGVKNLKARLYETFNMAENNRENIETLTQNLASCEKRIDKLTMENFILHDKIKVLENRLDGIRINTPKYVYVPPQPITRD